MNVCSLELAKELYELSGWDGTSMWWPTGAHTPTTGPRWDVSTKPAYDLGYLLRKLPYDGFELYNDRKGAWGALYSRNLWHEDEDGKASGIAATPENAVCLLAIELFKQGILKPNHGNKEEV